MLIARMNEDPYWPPFLKKKKKEKKNNQHEMDERKEKNVR